MRDQKGFTLIELLIVVVIIGILAAIAIPKFSSTREKAYFAAMKSDLKNLASQQEIYYADAYTLHQQPDRSRLRRFRSRNRDHHRYRLWLERCRRAYGPAWEGLRDLLRKCLSTREPSYADGRR